MSYKNKKYQAIASHRHYLKNKNKVIQKKNLARKRNKKFIVEYLLNHPCIDCNEKNIVVLEFDHVKGKKRKEISILANNTVSITTLLEEIKKCEVRCANCHKIRHYKNRLK